MLDDLLKTKLLLILIEYMELLSVLLSQKNISLGLQKKYDIGIFSTYIYF